MPTTAELIAGDNRPTEQIRIEIGADALVYQTIAGMKEAVGGLNPEIKRFDCSCLDGDYVTGDITPQYIADLITWGAIGARTTESQVHRELASGLSMPVGFKNGTSGSLQIAVDAIVSSSCPHCFLSVTKQGVSAIVSTTGNKSCHLILRGSSLGPNFDEDHVKEAEEALQKAGINNRIMIDCSHGNSCKDYRKQPAVAANIAEQISSGSEQVVAVMIESNIVEGAQPLSSDLVYGKSITDQCIGWETTVEVLETHADAVRNRRAKRQEA